MGENTPNNSFYIFRQQGDLLNSQGMLYYQSVLFLMKLHLFHILSSYVERI